MFCLKNGKKFIKIYSKMEMVKLLTCATLDLGFIILRMTAEYFYNQIPRYCTCFIFILIAFNMRAGVLNFFNELIRRELFQIAN